MTALKYILWLNTEKAVESYRQLKKKANFAEKRILNPIEKHIFRESILTEEHDLPFGIEVECLNKYIANSIKWPEPIREAYNKLGCKEGEDYDLVSVKQK